VSPVGVSGTKGDAQQYFISISPDSKKLIAYKDMKLKRKKDIFTGIFG